MRIVSIVRLDSRDHSYAVVGDIGDTLENLVYGGTIANRGKIKVVVQIELDLRNHASNFHKPTRYMLTTSSWRSY